MKIRLSLTFVLLLVLAAPFIFCETAPSSSPTTKTFIQSVSGGGRLIGVIQDANGIYISLSRNSDNSFLVRKTRSTGEKVWERKLHLDVPYPITLEGMAQTSDGGYILAGWGEVCDFYCYGPAMEGTLVKLASNGNLIWKKTYSARDTAIEFTSIVSSSDGGFVATANFNGQLELVKFTSTGDVAWIKTITDPAASGWRLVPTLDNGYLLASNEAHVIKLNDSGAIVWTKSLEIEGFRFQRALATSDGGVVLAFSEKCSRCDQVSLVGLLQDGTVSWKGTYSLSLPTNVSVGIRDLIETPDLGFVIVGRSFLLKIDSSKKVAFSTTSIASSSFGSGSWIFNSPNGGFLVFDGFMQLSKLDSKGIVPGCLDSSLAASKMPRGPLKAGQPSISVVSDNLSLAINDIAGTSTASNLPVVTRCP